MQKTVLASAVLTCLLASASVQGLENPEYVEASAEDAATEAEGIIAHAQHVRSTERDVGEQVWRLDQQTQRNPRAIQPHKRNYFTISYFNTGLGEQESAPSLFDRGVQHTEVKFQLSVRVPVWEKVLGSDIDVYTAYTSKALFQAFNAEASAPFRDINHEPEVFVLVPTQWSFGPVLSRAVTFGFNHQSNGQSNVQLFNDAGELMYDSLSRSWNRIMLGAFFEQRHFLWHLQTWYRIPEEVKEDPRQALGDDNPDLLDYMGSFELTVQHRLFDRVTSIVAFRNNLDKDNNRGAFRWESTVPLTRKLNGFMQVFHGYGENLLDYNVKNTRLGLGVTFRGF